MRILHVIGGLAPRYGGPSTVAPEMCKALAARGHAVELWTTNIDGRGTLPVPTGVAIEHHGFTTTYYPVWPPRRYLTSPGLAWALRRRVHEFDVVHIHSLYLFHTAVASFYCRRRGVPYIIRPHGTLDPYHRARHHRRKAIYERLVERRNLNRAAGIHYTALREQQLAEAYGVTAPGFIVPLGVDVDAFQRAVDPDVLFVLHPELRDRRLVTFLGRITAKKGLGVLVNAFSCVAAAEPDAQLVIAGPDDEGLGAGLRRQVERRGLSARVTFSGLIAGDAKVALLQQSHIFALPSADENFAVSVVEAMAAGVPVVITEGVAIHEEIAAASAGVVVDLTTEAFAASIVSLLRDAAGRARLGATAREFARRYHWAAIAPRLDEMYVAAGGRRERSRRHRDHPHAR